MVIATIFTVVFLIKTFKAQSSAIEIQERTLQSQLKVQSLQQEITDIELLKFKKELLPEFSISNIKVQDKEDYTSDPAIGDTYTFRDHVTFCLENISNQSAYNLTIVPNDKTLCTMHQPWRPFEKYPPGYVKVPYFILQCTVKKAESGREKTIFPTGTGLTLAFSDLKGNKYKGQISYLRTREPKILLHRIIEDDGIPFRDGY